MGGRLGLFGTPSGRSAEAVRARYWSTSAGAREATCRLATYDGAMTGARKVAAFALCVGLAVGVVGGLILDLPEVMKVLGSSSDRPSAPGVTTEAAPVLPPADSRVAAAQDILSARAAAVKTQSKPSWMATVDASTPPAPSGPAPSGPAPSGPAPSGPAPSAGSAASPASPGLATSAFRRRQSMIFDNLVRLSLDEFSYGAVRLAPTLPAKRARQVGPKAWAVVVTGTYSLPGPGRGTQSFEATYTLVERAAGWRIADDSDGARSLQVWDLPGMRVLHSKSAIIIGNAQQAQMQEYSRIADSAVSRVSAVWGRRWNSQVVIVTPATNDEFAKLLLRSGDKGLDQVAAFTQGVTQLGERSQADRVVVNPKAFTALKAVGRGVIITHELTHVAVRSSTTGPVPIWLNEGMADYVGLSGLGLPRERVAKDLLTLVRAGKGPTRLPTDADFDPFRTNIAPSYLGSWLAVSRLVDAHGQGKVVAFYRKIATATTAVVAQPDVASAAQTEFPRSFGVSEGQFVQEWRRYLTTLAKSGA
jgi:hypothetical protein